MYKNYVEEYFVAGNSNRAAIRSIEVTVNSEETPNNPLILYGASGVRPIDVATALPFLIAVIEEPLPK